MKNATTAVSQINTKNISPQRHQLKRIYFYLTEGCNLACRHCWHSPKHQSGANRYPTLSVDLFKSIIRQGKPLGLSIVKLTGGEPLMHPQIEQILDFIKQEQLILSIETNAVLCTSTLAEKIAQCKTPAVSVSLDGVDAETHEWVRGVKGSFAAAIQGIEHLVNHGIKPQIIMSLMRHNEDQMEPLIRLAETLGAGSVKFNLVQPTGRGEKMMMDDGTLSIEELIRKGKWVYNTLAPSTNMDVFYDQPMAFRPMSQLFKKSNKGIASCGIFGIIGVIANGDYALCGIGNQIRELIFGDAATTKLKDVWENNPILNELRDGTPHRFQGICGACAFNHLCIGFCIAQNYYRGQSLWTPFWFCESAHQSGLFPRTRTNKELLPYEQAS